MNPCPCGFTGDPDKTCRCSPDQLQRYRQRISGPLLERIDLHIPVSRVLPSLLLHGTQDNETSSVVRARVCAARKIQMLRQKSANALIPHKEIASACLLDKAQYSYIEAAMTKLNLSARTVHRSLRVARTIADLQGETKVSTEHVSEALAYRSPDIAL